MDSATSSPVTDVAISVVGGHLRGLGDQPIQLRRLERQREPDRLGEPAAGEPGDELARSARPVGADQHPLPGTRVAAGQLSEGLPHHIDVIDGGVRARVPGRSLIASASPVPACL